MSAIDDIMLLARRYADAERVETKTVSWRVFGDSKKLDALEAGGDIQTKRSEAAIRWFSENWPEGADWPAEVIRPEPVEGQAA
jgi:hypothetical protein